MDEKDTTSGRATDFFSDIENMVGRELTDEERIMINWNPDEVDPDDIDTIERVDG